VSSGGITTAFGVENIAAADHSVVGLLVDA
jgi:hypothetical protein